MPGKVVYISGPITGVPNALDAFFAVETELINQGFTVLNPSRLPPGMTNEQYMTINFAMINAADAVYFMPGWENSRGATLERAYCEYTGKRVFPCG